MNVAENRAENGPARRRVVIPLHPFLFAAFPLLALYAHNLDHVPLLDTVYGLATTMLTTVCVWVVALVVLRNLRKSAIATSATMVALATWSPLVEAIPWPAPVFVGTAGIIAVAALVIALYRTRRPLLDTSSILNVAAGFLVLSSGWMIGSAFWRTSRPGSHLGMHAPILVARGSASSPRAVSKRVHGPVTDKTADLPDVYYVILDAYGRADSLKLFYNFDNGHFVRELERRGFYVAHHSRANYDETPLCLASSLNFDYLDDLARRVGPTGSLEACRAILDDNAVAASLSPLGYRYVYIGSGVSEAQVETADVELNNRPPIPEVEAEIFGPDALNPSSPVHHARYDAHRANLMGVFDSLDTVAKYPYKKFVFAHVLAPHPPFVLGPNGEAAYPRGPLTFADGNWLLKQMSRPQYIEGYTGQLQYVNRRALQAIDNILARSRRPPIIIVQGDHGSRMNIDWESLANTDVREPFSILNAYYVPAKVRGHLYDTISPVNSFRVVLDEEFGAHYKLLPDRSYYSTEEEPYAFTDVTGRTAIAPQRDHTP
ncbi:MAG TPA: hypothetical protein VKT77_20480 [Chthonomonadaceae bacterium]|nr:hypothetical protein [Chthonomonadaceae bacterium]